MGYDLEQRGDLLRNDAQTQRADQTTTGKQTRVRPAGDASAVRAKILALRAESAASSAEGIRLVTWLLTRPDAVFATEAYLETGEVIRDRNKALAWLPKVEALPADCKAAYDAAIKAKGGISLEAVIATAKSGEVSNDEAYANRLAIQKRKDERDQRSTTRKVDKKIRRPRAFEAFVQENVQNYYTLPEAEQRRIFDEWNRTDGARFDQREKQVESEEARQRELAKLADRLGRPPIQQVTLSPANRVYAPVARGKKSVWISRGSYTLPVPDLALARKYFALAKATRPSDGKVDALVDRYAADVRKSWPAIVGRTVDQRYDKAAAEAAQYITPDILIQFGRADDVAAAKRELNPFLDDGVTVDMDSPAWAYEICGQKPPGNRRAGLVTVGPKSAFAFRARFAGYLADRAWAARTGQKIADSVYAGDIAGSIRGITEEQIYKLLGKVLNVRTLTTIVSPKQQMELFSAVEDKVLGGGVLPEMSELQQLDFERRALGGKPLVTADGTVIPVGSQNLNQQRVMVARANAKKLEGTVRDLKTKVSQQKLKVKTVEDELAATEKAIIDIADKQVFARGTKEAKTLYEQHQQLDARRAKLQQDLLLERQTLANDEAQLEFTTGYQQELSTVTVDGTGKKPDATSIVPPFVSPIQEILRPTTLDGLDKRLAGERTRITQRIADTKDKLEKLETKGPSFVPVGDSGEGGLANILAQENYDREVAAYQKDLTELGEWMKKIDSYERDNRLGGVTTNGQLELGTSLGTNQDRWLTVEGRVALAALAGAEEALAFVVRILASIVDYSLPGLVEKGSAAVASMLGIDPKNLPSGITWAAAEMRKGAADLEGRAAKNTAATGGGWDVEIIKGVVGFLVLYLPTMGFGGAGAAIARAASAARYAELLGTSVGLATMGALATVGESWENKLRTIVPLAIMPGIGAKLGKLKIAPRIAATFLANTATDVLAQADVIGAGRTFAATGDLKKSIAVAGAPVNFSKAFANGLLGAAMEAHAANKQSRTARVLENEMPVLEYAPKGDAGPTTYLRLTIQGETRTWTELTTRPATKQKIVKIEAGEYAAVKDGASSPNAVLDVLNRAVTRGDVNTVLGEATTIGTERLGKLGTTPTDQAARTKLEGELGQVQTIRDAVGKAGRREPLTVEQLKIARAVLGDGTLGYAQIGDEVTFRQDVYEFQRDLAAKSANRTQTPKRWVDAQQVEYDAVCKQLEQLDGKKGTEGKRAELEQRRNDLGEQIAAAKERVTRVADEDQRLVGEQITAFEQKIGGKIKFEDAPGETPSPTVEQTRILADTLARTAPQPTRQQLDAELAKYNARQDEIAANYDKVQAGALEHPSGVTAERLKLAVEGDATGERIPLTFASADQFHAFQGELAAVLAKHGITDAVIQQLGSGTTGWRGNPNKEIGPWKPTSDVDFAIFSDQALQQALAIGVEPNRKITQGGRYTVLRNEVPGGKGFYDTPVGRDLQALAGRWNEKIYGTKDVDGFDFKLNLTDKPFSRAVTVVQTEAVRMLGGARLLDGAGTNQYFGVQIEKPRMAGRISEAVIGTRESHVTIFEPEEWAGLPDAAKTELRAGVTLNGAPLGTGVVKKPSGVYQMMVSWPAANALRARYGLPSKELHVTIGKASGVTERKAPVDEMADVQADDGN